MEVTFGDSPGIDTGGSARTAFVDPDRDEYSDATSCCGSDHNRDDGATFCHFTHREREFNRRYMVKVAAPDFYNTDTAVYNGPYEITLTDITGTRDFVSNLYQDTKDQPPSSRGRKREYAMWFQTGDNAAGYKLDRIQTFISHGGSPQFTLHSQTTDVPGSKLCDFRNPLVLQRQYEEKGESSPLKGSSNCSFQLWQN